MAKPETKTLKPEAMAAAAAEAADGKIVRVHNHARDGYRRGGKNHASGKVDHPPGTFDSEQLVQLQSDPKLHVEFVDPPKTDAAPKA